MLDSITEGSRARLEATTGALGAPVAALPLQV